MPTIGLLAGTSEPGLIENMGKAPSFTSVSLSQDDMCSPVCSICTLYVYSTGVGIYGYISQWWQLVLILQLCLLEIIFLYN